MYLSSASNMRARKVLECAEVAEAMMPSQEVCLLQCVQCVQCVPCATTTIYSIKLLKKSIIKTHHSVRLLALDAF